MLRYSELKQTRIHQKFESEIDIKNQQISIQIREIVKQQLGETEDSIQFDIFGLEVPFVNALRRIQLGELPTMAIDRVGIYKNTSIIPDQVLSHRLGLIPIKANPQVFNWLYDKNEGIDEFNSIKFSLKVKALKNGIIQDTQTQERVKGNNQGQILSGNFFNLKRFVLVYSSNLKWVPIGNQNLRFNQFRPVNQDILLVKLCPGQQIECEVNCFKSIGNDHAKFSPVATAYYKFVPQVRLKENSIMNEDALGLKNLCPKGVFDVQEIHQAVAGRKKKSKIVESGEIKAVVKNERNCSSCREYPQYSYLKREIISNVSSSQKYMELLIDHIESVGILDPEQIFIQSLKILKQKAGKWKKLIH